MVVHVGVGGVVLIWPGCVVVVWMGGQWSSCVVVVWLGGVVYF